MAIAPVPQSAIFICYWIALRIRVCHAPWLGILGWLIDSDAISPSDTLDDKRERAFYIWIRSRYGRAAVFCRAKC